MGYPGGWGGGALGSIFAGYVLLTSQSPYPIIVYCMVYNYYRPYLSHFWANVIYFVNFSLCIYLIKPSSSVKLINEFTNFFKFLETIISKPKILKMVTIF